MKLADLIHAPTRLSWTLRLLLYIAVFVTASLAVQIVSIVLW
jgi:hypothetical protein